ncbi:efflux transporter outer membrane subunit [Altererythrobacter xixiisoli]|uniref:Efflux transporter outer membrane subunit n=1 Tax=Croceibacterium xixiisoli TaxID=1476466 RepID=A0A6I4TWA0_9SPHN|nr:efflux transporter outer membrane subunit [Croceibacterium xixiisoli]MXO99489.1 efflux transporter outer membrane subunit [Croceibacterium xixiisoli]
MRKSTLTAALSVLALASGCSMNPKLDIPAPPVAAQFAGADKAEPESAATIPWRQMFGDARLQAIIALALENNRDLRVTTLNVEAARSQFRMARGAQLPSIDANGSYTRQRIPLETAGAGLGLPSDGAAPSGIEFGQYSANVALTAFEIDLFGRLRSQSEAAFERYLASDEGRRAARIALIGAVVDAYLAERLAVEQLALTERTLIDWRESARITGLLREARQASGLEVSQADGLVRQAEADLQARLRAQAQATNALQLLTGAPLPADLPPPVSLLEQPILTQLPAGLPSDLLTNRPDIRQAERELVAANADIGAARAAFFPRLSITGLLGVTSLAFDRLFDTDNGNWSFSPQISQPIFRGGSLQGELRLAEVRKSIAIAQYEQVIQAAFREVSDGLAGRATYGKQSDAQQAAADAAARRVELSNLRYRAGVDSRLELLDAQRSLYSARQTYLDLRREELSSATGLYRALGGGEGEE